jgi:hypothetical protein
MLVKSLLTKATLCFSFANIAINCHAASGVARESRIVAMSGQQAPDVPVGMVFTGVLNPVINNRGETAFIAGVVDPTTPGSDRIGIWSEGGGRLHLVALDGAVPQGIALPVYHDLIFAFNDRGETAFRTAEAIWKESNGSLERVIGSGEPVLVGGRIETLQRFSRPVINRHGSLSFAAAEAGEFPRTGMFLRTDGQLSLIADNSTQFFDGDEFAAIHLGAPAAINATGQAAFWAESFYDGSVWTNARGSLERIARTVVLADELGERTLRSVRSPIVTTPGDVVFLSNLAGEGITRRDDETLWKLDRNGLRLVVREGQQAPEFADEVVFGWEYSEDSFPSRAVSDDAGNLTIKSGLRGPGIDIYNQESIWRTRNDELELVVQSGSQAPGTEAGTQFWHLDRPLLSKKGRIAFQGELIGAGIDSLNDRGIWAEDVRGNFQLIVREGDLLDLDPGTGEDLRKVAEVTLLNFLDSRGEDDQPYAFNNRGEIAFRVAFSDLTQAIVVSNLLVVLEPSTSTLVGLGLALVGTMKLRTRREFR